MYIKNDNLDVPDDKNQLIILILSQILSRKKFDRIDQEHVELLHPKNNENISL